MIAKLIDLVLVLLIAFILASLLFRVVHAVEMTASVPLTTSNFWTTYHLAETLICSL